MSPAAGDASTRTSGHAALPPSAGPAGPALAPGAVCIVPSGLGRLCPCHTCHTCVLGTHCPVLAPPSSPPLSGQALQPSGRSLQKAPQTPTAGGAALLGAQPLCSPPLALRTQMI